MSEKSTGRFYWTDRYNACYSWCRDRPLTDYDAIDFFRGDELVADPYPYFDWLRAQCPVQREQHHDVMMVTGYDEAIAVYNDTDDVLVVQLADGPVPRDSRSHSRATTSTR